MGLDVLPACGQLRGRARQTRPEFHENGCSILVSSAPRRACVDQEPRSRRSASTKRGSRRIAPELILVSRDVRTYLMKCVPGSQGDSVDRPLPPLPRGTPGPAAPLPRVALRPVAAYRAPDPGQHRLATAPAVAALHPRVVRDVVPLHVGAQERLERR